MVSLWEKTISQIRDSLPAEDYAAWFSRLYFGRQEEENIVLYVPSNFIRDHFEEDYREIIENTISELGERQYHVVFEVKKNVPENRSSVRTAAEKPKTEPKEEQKSTARETRETRKKTDDECVLNPAYTFDSFVPGDNSSFAYNACMAIAKNPGSAYNPCLIYGGVGLGKTHLLQSIGNYILETQPKMKIISVTAENFTNEFISAINDRNLMVKFKNKYRKASVLLIDDIHFLQKKDGVQQELFNTFNDLYDSGRQIVFTCDRPIEELRDISDRLRSRFTRGLNIDLLPPDYETRMAILRKKCQEKNFVMSDDVMNYIATNISTNVRDLESGLTKLMAYSTLLHKDISLETAQEQLKHIVSSNNDTSGISIDLIVKTVSSYFNVSPFDIKGKNKSQSFVLPRQIAMYLCRKLTDFSTTEIGSEFGGKNHTTVMYNVQKVETMLNSSQKDISVTLEKLTSQIKSAAKK